MSRGLGRMQTLLMATIRCHDKPMTFVDIVASILEARVHHAVRRRGGETGQREPKDEGKNARTRQVPNETHLKRLMPFSRHITRMEGRQQENRFISVVRIP
jgi:hypothetical protein